MTAARAGVERTEGESPARSSSFPMLVMSAATSWLKSASSGSAASPSARDERAPMTPRLLITSTCAAWGLPLFTAAAYTPTAACRSSAVDTVSRDCR